MASYTSLRDTEFKLYGEIVQLRSIANTLQLEETASLSDLEALVIGHRFRVAVVGEFNRGKSTVINALLGAEVLPASIEACSAALNRVTYGSHVTARVVMRGEEPPEDRSEEVHLHDLVAYVTKLSPDAAHMASSVEEAVITYPSRFCRNNVDLIDTPGLNDEPTMTAVTMRSLGRINAAVMVIRAAFSFSRSEQLLLEKLLSHDVTSILFLVTAIDELDEDDRPRIVRETKNRILKALRQYADDVYGEETEEYDAFLARFGEPRVYGVAALMALEARHSGDSAAEQASGYPAFETALEELLATRDGSAAIVQTARKLLKVHDQITRAIQEQNDHVSEQLLMLNMAEHELMRVVDYIRADAETFAQHLHRDAEDSVFRIRQLAQRHSERLKEAAATMIQSLSIESRDVVAIAGRFWNNPTHPAHVAPDYRNWAINVAQNTSSPGLHILETLSSQLHTTLSATWQEVVATMVRHIFTDTTELRRRIEAKSQDWIIAIEASLSQLDEQTKTNSLDLQVVELPNLATVAADRAIIVKQVVALPPKLQVQPTMVAVRSVTGVLSTSQGQIEPDSFLREFQTLCQRAVHASIDAYNEQRLEQLEKLIDHAEQVVALITLLPSTIAEALCSVETGPRTKLLRHKEQFLSRVSHEQQQRDQLAEKMNAISTTTTSLLRELEQEVV